MNPKLIGLPRKLAGDRNQCPTCKRYFNSTSAFEKHRTGTIGSDRRCMTVPEMEARGMATNRAGFWMTKRRHTESILRPPVDT